MRTRLVYVSNSILLSGQANAVHVTQMCDAFAGLDCDVSLQAERKGQGEVASDYGLRQHFALQIQRPFEHRLWLLWRRLMRMFAARSQTIYFGRRLMSLARLARWGYATGIELHHPPRNAKQFRALSALVASPRFLGMVVISERLRAEIQQQLPQLDSRKILVAHDGVRSDHIRAPELRQRTPLRAVYCGSFHPGKGVETILSAARLLPEVAFDLIGGEAVQIEAIRCEAPPNVRLLGRLAHMETQRLLPDYDVALAPYASVVRGAQTPEHESLASWMSPLKIFEYMGAGLPIITSDLPVLREILESGESALMLAPGDPSALVSALNDLVRQPERRLQLAQLAQQRLRGYTWEQRAARILEFLRAGLV